ncbi:hypothetical protein DFJ74DRAFT_656859 [Hyaloraphidium curvatum]|nr:hypothetical protein DFJ74DRAFT_656859 [Hyaloraphidium curvatum]
MLLTAARSSCEGGAGGGGDGTAKDPHCQAQGTLGGSGTDPLVGSTEGQAGAWEPPHVFTFSSPTDHRRVTYHRAPARSALAPLSPTSIRANADMSASVLSKARGMALSPPTSPGRVKQKTPVKEAARPGSAPVSPPSSDPSTNAENALGVAVGLTAFAQRLQRIDEEPAQPASDPPAEHCEKAAVPEAAPAPAEADDEDTATRGIVLPSYGLDDSDDEDENASPAQRNSSKQPRKQALPRPSLSLHAGRRKPFAPLGATSAGSSAAGPGSALRATSGGSPGSSWARLNQKLHTPQDKAPRHPSQSPGSSNGEPRKKSPGSQGSAPRSVGAFEFDPYYSAPSFAIVEIPAPPPRPQSPAPIEDCSSPFFVPPPLAAAGNSPSEPPAKPHKKRKHREIEGLPSSGKHRKHLVTRSGPGGHVAKAPNLRHPPKLKLKKVPPPGHPAYLKTKAFSNSASRLAAKADSVIIGSMPVTYKKLKTGAGGESHRGASAPKQGSPLAKEQSSSSPPSSPLSNMSDKENGREASRWLPLPVKARKFTEEQGALLRPSLLSPPHALLPQPTTCSALPASRSRTRSTATSASLSTSSARSASSVSGTSSRSPSARTPGAARHRCSRAKRGLEPRRMRRGCKARKPRPGSARDTSAGP